MDVIGLDIGTTGCKVCIFDESGAAVGTSFREYPVICTEPGMGEQDADLVWKQACSALKEATAVRAGDAPTALCCSVQGDAVIPVDGDFRPLGHALLGMDYRAQVETADCEKVFGARQLFDTTGMRPHPMNSLVKMMWLKRHRPDVFSRAAHLVTYADYFAGRMTGEAVIDLTMASRTMAFDAARRQWAGAIIDKAEIPAALLSRPVASATVVGAITRQAAAECGLCSGTRFVAGGHDQACAALGAGVLDNRRGVISTGTAEVLSTAFSSRPSAAVMFDSYYPCSIYASPDLFFTFALNHSGGILFRWYRDTLGVPETETARRSGRDPYDEIIAGMPVGPSPVMVLPHFGGSGTPVCDTRARGAIVGLSLATTRHDIAKAALEALCFELRINIDRMQQAGIGIDELWAVGGGAKSAEWLQLKADVLGRQVTVPKNAEAAGLGAAMLAAAGSGVFSNVNDTVAQWVHPGRTCEPDSRRNKEYTERYAVYQRLYPALREISHSF